VNRSRVPPPESGISMELDIIALVSIGLHPASNRPRRADHDARAVELGLRLVGTRLQVLHAGNPEEPALRSYLGMGLGPGRLTVLEQTPDADALPVLVQYLKEHADVHVVLTGSQAETGEGSGLVPFLLAEHLGWPLIHGLVEIESVEKGWAKVLQALPRGQRRRLEVRLPFVASVDSSAPTPRQSAFALARRRGQIGIRTLKSTPDTLLTASRLQPARARPKRLKVIKAKTGADRMRAATAKASGEGGKVLENLTPAQGAQAIFKLLHEEGVVR